MGIFGKVFDKKVCDICGGDIGLLGNRKLADGNLCKDCARKLSPWMTDRRQSTVEEISQHLAYREKNREVLATIHPTKVLGTGMKVYVDEAAGKFFVTRSGNWREQNPDVIDISQVVDVQTEVTEHRTEQYHNDREGNSVPFDPPRYDFSYEFETTLIIDSPYFNEIGFELTDDRPENRLSREYREYEQMANDLRATLMPATVQAAPGVDAKNLAQALSAVIGQAAASVNSAAKAAAANQAEPEKWTCTCGAVNDGKFCPNCGAKRPEKPKAFRCNKCGWQPEDPSNPPKFCPNCGDPFNEGDAV